MMDDPKVSFIVPCFKLGHLLADCVNSILAQTYGSFEILILDDQSPDCTPEVGRSFTDPRVKYSRNQVNLGHLRNYNEGIARARGKYIWLISADDRLRKPYVLERYVETMERHPKVGYIFCPAVDLVDQQEAEVLLYSQHGDGDAIFDGHSFFLKLLKFNPIAAPSAMVRADLYRKNPFPLDMPWGGDWYLWCRFALESDVAYLAEPMVCYRRHHMSMSNLLVSHKVEACVSDDTRLPWILKREAEYLGHAKLAKACLQAAVDIYGRNISSSHGRNAQSAMTREQFEESLVRHASNAREKDWVRARVWVAVADQHYRTGELPQAREGYLCGLRQDPGMLKAWLKLFLVSSGRVGTRIRRTLAFRRSKTSWQLPVEKSDA